MTHTNGGAAACAALCVPELPAAGECDTQALHARAVRSAIAAMHERMPDELSLDQLARIAAMSPFHFNRTFRRITGVPPHRFLTALRLHRARQLLLTTDASVTDVCFDVGYNSLGTFVRRFTDLIGCCPTQVRAFARAPLALPSGDAPAIAAANGSRDGVVSGEVVLPPGFSGVTFVGLFAGPIPEGRPVACAIVGSGFRYRIASTPAGMLYTFGVAIRGNETAAELMLCDDAPRGGGTCVRVRGRGETTAPPIVLRAPAAEDPPILSLIPLLLASRQDRCPDELLQVPAAQVR